jgi:hypothetical protein
MISRRNILLSSLSVVGVAACASVTPNDIELVATAVATFIPLLAPLGFSATAIAGATAIANLISNLANNYGSILSTTSKTTIAQNLVADVESLVIYCLPYIPNTTAGATAKKYLTAAQTLEPAILAAAGAVAAGAPQTGMTPTQARAFILNGV